MDWIITNDNYNNKDYVSKIIKEELKNDHQVVDIRVNPNKKNILIKNLISELNNQTGYDYKVILFIIDGSRYTIHKIINWGCYSYSRTFDLINELYNI